MTYAEFLKIGNYRIDDIKKLCDYGTDRFFFSKDTMKFFNSRTSDLCWEKGNLIYFITSEKYDNDPRLYTVRSCDPKGHIETKEDMKKIETLYQARNEIKNILKI